MIKLTDSESGALQVIRTWQERFRNSPSVPELAEELQLSANTTRNILHSLLDKGFIDMLYPSTGTSRRMMIMPLYWE